MEMETSRSPSPLVVTIDDSEEMNEVWAEEIVIDEDGSLVEQEWNDNDVLTFSSSGSVKLLDDEVSSNNFTSPFSNASPSYILPDLFTDTEDNVLEESFKHLEELMSKKNSVQWKEADKKSLAEKAQDLLNDLDDIKQELFPDWLEEKADLPLLEELNGFMSSSQLRPNTSPASIAVTQQYQSTPLHILSTQVAQIAPQLASPVGLTLLSPGAHIEGLTDIRTHVPAIPADVPSVTQTSPEQQPPLTPALIREFESVLHQTLTPPHTPPTYLDLVNNQEEENKTRIFSEELDALINSQVASFYDEKQEKEWSLTAAQNSPTSDWSSASTSVTNEDSDSACQSSSEADPDWAPSVSVDRSCTSRNRRAISSLEERKLRKKEQNKNAATRYRLKKKAEQAGIMDEESVLVEKNTSLKEKATELHREIKYLKSLMRDVCKAKGLIQ